MGRKSKRQLHVDSQKRCRGLYASVSVPTIEATTLVDNDLGYELEDDEEDEYYDTVDIEDWAGINEYFLDIYI